MPGQIKTGSGPVLPEYFQSKITQKPADSIKQNELKTQKSQERTFEKLVKKSFDSEAFDVALRAQLKIDQSPKETAGTHRLPVNLDDTKLWSVFDNRKDPFGSGKVKFHKGVDLGGEIGLPVRATASGRVIRIHKSKSYGKNITIEHKDGTISFYAHLNSFGPIKAGQKINAGHLIGKVGKTGKVKGPHLHYELRSKDGALLDPLKYFPEDQVAKLKKGYEAMMAKNNNKKDKSTLLAMRQGNSHSH